MGEEFQYIKIADVMRQKIVAKVHESFDARHEARCLLDEAKAMVERAVLDGDDS